MTCTHDTSAYNDAAHHHTAFGYRKGLAVQKMLSRRTFIDLCCDLEHSSPFLLLLLAFFSQETKAYNNELSNYVSQQEAQQFR